ncbi:MAG: formate dehydrogenase, partial [Halomonas sp.]|nr:formate dehydrogenase [Halomonas sp.]
NRIAEGKLPLCADICSTKALLAGDSQDVADIFRQRVVHRGHPDGAWSNNPQASADNLAYDATRKG